MERSYYFLRKIPDLSLNKYSVYEENGVGGLLSGQRAFLRQLNRKGLLSSESFHLIIEYDPSRPGGNKLNIVFVVGGRSTPSRIPELIKSSPIGRYYEFIPVSESDSEFNLNRDYRYESTACLIKKEKFSHPDDPQFGDLYTVSEWETNENARLYQLMTLMKGLNKPTLYCVNLYPVDYTEQIEEWLKLPLKNLRAMLSMRVDKTANGIMASGRDEHANFALRRYEKLLEDTSASPHYLADIRVMADDIETATMLLDAAASESITEGSHSIVSLSHPMSLSDEEALRFASLAGRNAPRELRFMPQLFTLDEISPFFAFPALYDGESIEIPKESAPSYHSSGLYLGEDQNKYSVYFPLKSLSKHAFIAGVPGSGKTNSMLHLATELYAVHGIPFLILEPAKQEYRALLNREELKNVLLFSPSAGSRFQLHINPFEFPLRMSLAEHIRKLNSVFEGAFYLEAPMPFLLDGAIEAVYADLGWQTHTINTGELPYPTMHDLYVKLEKKLEETDYDSEIKSNLKSALQVRIGSLITREMGDVFDVEKSTLSPEEWLSRPVIIELESMGPGPANFLTLMLATLIRETLKVNPLTVNDDKNKPRHVIFFEEAHNLIGPQSSDANAENTSPKAAATAFIVKMLAEVRALNEAIIIADQLPTAMAPEVIKNTSLKIGHRITAEDDRMLLGSTMSADAVQLERMTTFSKGRSLVIYEDLLRPFELQMAKWAKQDDEYISPDDDTLYELMLPNPDFRECLRHSASVTTKKLLDKFDDCTEELESLASTVRTNSDTSRKYEIAFEAADDGDEKTKYAEYINVLTNMLTDNEIAFRNILDHMIGLIFTMCAFSYSNRLYADYCKEQILAMLDVYIKARKMFEQYGFKQTEEARDRLRNGLKKWEIV